MSLKIKMNTIYIVLLLKNTLTDRWTSTLHEVQSTNNNYALEQMEEKQTHT